MVVETGETVPQLIHAARALREVRRMQQRFMVLWAMDKAASHRNRERRQRRRSLRGRRPGGPGRLLFDD